MGIFTLHPYNSRRLSANFYALEKDKIALIIDLYTHLDSWEKDFINNLNNNYYKKRRKVSEKQYKIFNNIYKKIKNKSDLSLSKILNDIKYENNKK